MSTTLTWRALWRERDGNSNVLHNCLYYDPFPVVLHVRRGHGCLGTWTAYEV